MKEKEKREKFRDIKKTAKAFLKVQTGDLILGRVLVTFGLALAAAVSLNFGKIVFKGPAEYGLYRMNLKALRNEKISQRDLLSGFKEKFGDSFIASLIVQFIMMIPKILIGAFVLALMATFGSHFAATSKVLQFLSVTISSGTFWSSLVTVVITVICIIVAGIFLYAFRMSQYILMRVFDIRGFRALKASAVFMKGEKFRMFRFDLSFIPWFILIPLTAGILWFWVMPYYTAARTAFMTEIFERRLPVYVRKAEALNTAAKQDPAKSTSDETRIVDPVPEEAE